MRRVLLVLAVSMLLIGGCVDADFSTGPSEETPEVPSDDPEANETERDHENDPTPASDVTIEGELEIHHIDVGQADSTLLVTPDGETVLVDTGDWRQDGSDVLAYLDAHDIDRIDHLIATHGHADHIGGHAAIIEEFETNRGGIGAAYDSGVPHTTQTYEKYLDAVEKHDVELFVVEDGDELPIEDETLSALVVNPPAGDSGDDLHYNSIAVVFEFGDVRYLITGDAEADAESRMLESWSEELDVDVYQAGHHGSSTSSSPAFLDIVSPEIAIISSNFDSQYGHPHDEVLVAFDERDIETYWTAVHGDIVLTTDGNDFAVETVEEFSADPEELLDAKPDDENDAGSYSVDHSPPSIEVVG